MNIVMLRGVCWGTCSVGMCAIISEKEQCFSSTPGSRTGVRHLLPMGYTAVPWRALVLRSIQKHKRTLPGPAQGNAKCKLSE